jgi:hypothetical protein
MIARIWRGWAPPERADDYQRHQAGVVGEQCDLGSAGQAGLGQDVGHVRLDGGHAYPMGV